MEVPLGADKSKIRVATKLQVVNRLGEGKAFDDGVTYSVEAYRAQADKFRADWVLKNEGQVRTRVGTYSSRCGGLLLGYCGRKD